MDRGASRATRCGIAKNLTGLSTETQALHASIRKRVKLYILWGKNGGCHENYLFLTNERVRVYLNNPACTTLFLFAQTWVNITLEKRAGVAFTWSKLQ